MKYHPLTSEIRSAYKAAANPHDAPDMQRYMKSDMPFYGIKTAVRRKIDKTVFNKYKIKDLVEYERVIRELWSGKYREERYTAIGFAIKYEKFHLMEAIPLYRMMIESGAWWDYVDSIAIYLVGALLRKFPSEMKGELEQWIEDDHLWIRRAAIIAQVSFRADTYHELLFRFCRICMHEKSFWIRKAIGWALRDYSKHEPERVRRFVDENRENLSGLSLKEASKYI